VSSTCGCAAPGTGACGCGSCGSGTPPVTNVAGLDQIAYRAGDFASFRSALLSPLAGEQQLTNWAPDPGDLGLQVLEWWAYLADILTFYNERIANNNYLRTAATQPGPGQSAAGLAKLVGYRTRPGIAATGTIAAIRSAGAADSQLLIPSGLQVTSTPTATAPAQLFETDETLTFTGPSDGMIELPPPNNELFQLAPQDGGQASVLLAGNAAVTAGQMLLLVSNTWDGRTQDWAVTSAGATAAEPNPNGSANTKLELTATAWQSLATDSSSLLASDYLLLSPTATALLWTMPTKATSAKPPPTTTASAEAQSAKAAATTATSTTTAATKRRPLTVPLATLVRGVAPGDIVLFTSSAPAVQVLAYVTDYAEEVTAVVPEGVTVDKKTPRAYVPHTTLTVRAPDESALRKAVRDSELGSFSMRYAFREVGTLIPAPAVTLSKLPATVAAPAGLLPSGQVALTDANGIGLLVNAAAPEPGSVTLEASGGTSGSLESPLTAPIRLLANLVAVSQGTTVQGEVLGNGDPTAAGQTFTLQHSPLIYLPSSPPGGAPVSTLSIAVDGVSWTEVPAFSGQSPTATVYVTVQLPTGYTSVVFGDGINGARLPRGTGNVIATYRYGSSAKPPPAGALSTVLQPQPGLASIVNPVSITAGTAPETASQTAQDAPATVALIASAGSPSAGPPVISADDAERLAATVSGVTRVKAYWAWDQVRRSPAITVYVGGGDASNQGVADEVQAALAAGTTLPLSVLPAEAEDLLISCELVCAPGTSEESIKKAARRALTNARIGLSSPPRMGIGQGLYRSEVEAALTVSGVIALLGLEIRRASQPASQQHSPPSGELHSDEVLSPGQGGYFTIPADGLSLEAVTR
jgi:hypothetical protein